MKDKYLTPTRPSAALRTAYQKKLLGLVDKMSASVEWWLGAEYKRVYPQFARDSKNNPGERSRTTFRHSDISTPEDSPGEGTGVGFLPRYAFDGAAEDLYKELRRVMSKWQKEFNSMGSDIAKWFAKSSAGYTSVSIKEALKEAGYTVKFKNSRKVRDMIRSIVIQNASLIKSISGEYRMEVEGLIQRSVQSGRDIGFLREELEKRYGITKRRAVLIARDQNNKATEAIKKARHNELGLTEGEWIHIPGRKTSRATHKAMNGKRFNINEGLYDGDVGRKVLPAELVACACTYRVLIPEFGVK